MGLDGGGRLLETMGLPACLSPRDVRQGDRHIRAAPRGSLSPTRSNVEFGDRQAA